MQTRLAEKIIVLLGAGHTNAHVLTNWRMQPIDDARLVCVSDFPVATYSGMLPGVLAGLFPAGAMQIDLVRLCRAVGAELIIDQVVGLDVHSQRLLFQNRPPLRFDALSIGIGSMPDDHIVDQNDGRVLAIKPMQSFLPRLTKAAELAVYNLDSGATLEVAIVGGGVAGVEIALCLQHWLAKRFPARVAHIALINSGKQVANGLSQPAQKLAAKELHSRSIETLSTRRAVRISNGTVRFDNGEVRDFSLVILATSATPKRLLEKFDLLKDEQGFLQTDATLRTLSGAPVFAVGDCGSMAGQSLPKAGVYAVRQGPILWTNIRNLLSQKELVEYKPQRTFLKLLATGDGRAIGSYRGFGFANRFTWRWKKFIDQRFMRMHQDYRPTAMSTPSASEPMRCVGCGGKVGGEVLRRVLDQLKVPKHARVVGGLGEPDDAAVLSASKTPALLTTDFFAPPIDDLFLAGRIAMVNALNDVYAMGGRPVAALASITVPHGPAKAQEQLLLDVLFGALSELRSAEATLAGGHTLEGPRITIGFTVFGDLDGQPMTKARLQPGDALVLTKPLGVGALLAAYMTADCCADWFESLISCMRLTAAKSAACARRCGIEAATDVTGFGLAGHLLEMLRASNCGATLSLDSIPLLPGAEKLLREGRESTMASANRRFAEPEIDADAADKQSAKYRSLFDPQTAGGLLLAVAQRNVPELLRMLHEGGYQRAAIVGAVRPLDRGPRIRCG